MSDPLHFYVGIVEVNFRDKYPHIEKLFKDFSGGNYSDIYTEDNGDGSYLIALPIVPGEIKRTEWNGYFSKFFVEGEKISMSSLPILPEENGLEDKINQAKYVREKFLKFLEEERIPHKVLLRLFDD
jgi:hypothetical protein